MSDRQSCVRPRGDGTPCPEVPRWRVVLVLRHSSTTRMRPQLADMQAWVCDAHRAERAEDWLTDAGWAKLQAACAAAGLPRPRRGLTLVEFVPADEDLGVRGERVPGGRTEIATAAPEATSTDPTAALARAAAEAEDRRALREGA